MGRNNCHFVNLQGAQPDELYVRVKHNEMRQEKFFKHHTG